MTSQVINQTLLELTHQQKHAKTHFDGLRCKSHTEYKAALMATLINVRVVDG